MPSEYLLLLLLIPLLFSIISLFTGKYSKIVSSVLAGLFIIIVLPFLPNINYSILNPAKYFGISIFLDISYLSYPLVLLTSIVIFFAILYQDGKIESSYFSYLFFLEFSLIGVFISQNLILFYIFWELVLIPSYFMILRWGGPKKDYTALKFLIYTHVGSVLMLISIFILGYNYYTMTGSFNFNIPTVLSNQYIGNLSSLLLFIVMMGFFLAFFIKLPTFPFHTWAPDVYVESPTTSSMVFSGLLSKMGAFGLFSIFVRFLPFSGSELGYLLLALALISIVYAAFAALAQKDLKRLIAYSSIGHMGFITLAVSVLFLASPLGLPSSDAYLALEGGMFMMFAHGLIVPILFGSVGSIERSTGTRAIRDLGGLTKMMPNLAFVMVGGFLASLGLPGMAGFIAEFSVVVGSWNIISYLAFIVVFGLVVVASYHIWALQRTLFGPYNNYLGNIKDMLPREFWPLIILLILVIIVGIYPTPIYSMFVHYAQLIGGM
ncbi:MAG: complex I subunit 4 family protein [Thermoplasmata archaeon]